MEGRRFDEHGKMGVRLHPDRLDKPLHWRKPRRIFVNSLSDLFHKDIPDEFIGSVWNTMALTPQHSYQILTKRPQRMRALLNKWADDGWMWRRSDLMWCGPLKGPLPNVWLGVSAENQQYADLRIPHLLRTPAAVRFVSYEPALGPILLGRWLHPELMPGICVDIDGMQWHEAGSCPHCRPAISWVICGGESGPGARPMDLDWARSVVAQCKGYGVAAFVKQLGSHYGKAHHDIETFPPELRVREYPR